ncbi:hypothetical protein AQJ84_30075 [Streptomyces resistomycificus]|uniref:Uncharacterized protein n=1 Tax=Streptomyces resistomycificus TaxID=67356 RepID=A0A0L8L951_9ACTN|nr:hypothetical protein ADK37_17760 [Streptomyces resistomycificus]KUN93331.1 hypothetical protein AQJ84_30075 [Streptomyces resistomycificus]
MSARAAVAATTVAAKAARCFFVRMVVPPLCLCMVNPPWSFAVIWSSGVIRLIVVIRSFAVVRLIVVNRSFAVVRLIVVNRSFGVTAVRSLHCPQEDVRHPVGVPLHQIG